MSARAMYGLMASLIKSLIRRTLSQHPNGLRRTDILEKVWSTHKDTVVQDNKVASQQKQRQSMQVSVSLREVCLSYHHAHP